MGADLSTLGITTPTPDGPCSMTDEEMRSRSIGKMDVEMRKRFGYGTFPFTTFCSACLIAHTFRLTLSFLSYQAHGFQVQLQGCVTR